MLFSQAEVAQEQQFCISCQILKSLEEFFLKTWQDIVFCFLLKLFLNKIHLTCFFILYFRFATC